MSAAPAISLQRRLLLYLMIAAPLVWALALVVSLDRARHEVNELFDTEMIRLARQVQVMLDPAATAGTLQPLAPPPADTGEGDLRDLAISVWDRTGRRVWAGFDGDVLPHPAGQTGFVDQDIGGEPWRVYYLPDADDTWHVAAGQKAYERDELVLSLALSQFIPWLLVLPVLLAAMAWGVRRALAPVHTLAQALRQRAPDDLQPVDVAQAPVELAPLAGAMNSLFGRIGELLARERRFTADAAHELRTPLAVLRAQWDVVRASHDAGQRAQAEAAFDTGLVRMDRLVTQMLALSRLDTAQASMTRQDIHWPRVVEQVFSDCLPLADQRHTELACTWPDDPDTHPFPLLGDPDLLAVLLRNLVDNAVRYSPPGSTVWLRIGADSLSVDNPGPVLNPQQLARLGERFYRPEGQDEPGSGLGVSIVQRIAQLHGLRLQLLPGPHGQGLCARLVYADAAPPGATLG